MACHFREPARRAGLGTVREVAFFARRGPSAHAQALQFFMVFLLMGLSRFRSGNTNRLLPDISLSSIRTRTACLDNGTTGSAFNFIRSAEIIHKALFKSNSTHFAGMSSFVQTKPCVHNYGARPVCLTPISSYRAIARNNSGNSSGRTVT